MGNAEYMGELAPRDALASEKWIPGLRESLVAVITPHAPPEGEQWDADELAKRLNGYIIKAAYKFCSDERLKVKGSQMQAHCLVEELVENALSTAGGSCDGNWFFEADFLPPFKLAVAACFKDTKLFSRIIPPMFNHFIEDSIGRVRREMRLHKTVWQAVTSSQVPDVSKATKHLMKSYDDAHISAPYGTSEATTAELGYVQDFLKGWINSFVGIAWDTLENGVGAKEQQIKWLTNLFQYLTHPDRCCIPYDLLEPLEEPLPAEWYYVPSCVEMVYMEAEMLGAEKSWKKQQKIQQTH